MTLDVARIRSSYPALKDGYAYLDGAAGTQVPSSVVEAISGAYLAGLGNIGGAFPASHRAGEIDRGCRRAVADLVGGEPLGVILGPNMTTLTYRLAATLSDRWSRGDEVVVSRLDHDANVRPWIQAASRAGALVRWAEVDLRTGELPADQYDELLSERTRLVAVTAASNVLGTRPDVAAITAKAHLVGALTYIDGVHWTPHGAVDVAALGADFYATSAYKWSGPHVGAVIARPELLETLHPDKLAPATDAVPGRFERGTPPFADLAGVIAAVEHLASLDPAAAGSRRERILTSMAAVERYEGSLFQALAGRLEAMGHVTTYSKAPRRAPTAYFNVAGRTPLEVAEHLAERRINVWNGDNYAWELAGVLKLRDSGGAVRAGLVHYSDESDVNRLLDAVAELETFAR
ncbi:MAG TPA: cysteine desulfurase-like protein [Acidimicrobiales bacterium]|nr:cysteine desulfurase-like protein [Acidimicrobiales bacterium]